MSSIKQYYDIKFPFTCNNLEGFFIDLNKITNEDTFIQDIAGLLLPPETNDGKVTFAAACGKEALELGANAGKIVKSAAQMAGGNGGGKPDMAMAGAKDAEKVQFALDSVKAIVFETGKHNGIVADFTENEIVIYKDIDSGLSVQ